MFLGGLLIKQVNNQGIDGAMNLTKKKRKK
jgi:hypothetical protein